MGICSNLDRLMASGLGRVPGCVASALPCPGLSVSWEGAWSLLLLPAPPGLLEKSLGASFINGWMLQGSCNSSLCSGVGCPAVEQESKCAPVENKWGGLVVSECQLLQSFLGLIPALSSLLSHLLPDSAQEKLPMHFGACRLGVAAESWGMSKFHLFKNHLHPQNPLCSG